MYSIQYNPGEFFEIQYFFVFYGYDRNTKSFKDPVHKLFQIQFNMLNPSQNTVGDFTMVCMNSNPAVFSGLWKSPEKYFVHHILPPVVYPCDPTAVKLADVVNCYRDSNPLSNSMTITVDLIEKSEIA